MLNRTVPDAPATAALTNNEITLLDRLANRTAKKKPQPATLAQYLLNIAKLGGYLNRTSDPPPGNMVMWRGMTRLNDIMIGAKLVGN